MCPLTQMTLACEQTPQSRPRRVSEPAEQAERGLRRECSLKKIQEWPDTLGYGILPLKSLFTCYIDANLFHKNINFRSHVYSCSKKNSFIDGSTGYLFFLV